MPEEGQIQKPVGCERPLEGQGSGQHSVAGREGVGHGRSEEMFIV